MKSKTLLSMFVKYCEEHPEERFWQALRNWSNYSFIYGQKEGSFLVKAQDMNGKDIQVTDTFYIESNSL